MYGSPLAVAAAIIGILRCPIVVVDGERRHVPGTLLHHLRDLRVGDFESMLDGIAAAVERALESDPVIGMACYALAPAVSLIDDGLQLFDRERRLRNEIAFVVHPGTMRHVHLDPIGAVVELLARSLARLDWTINELSAFGNGDLGRVALKRISTGRRNRACGNEHSRAGNVAGVDRLFDSHIAVAGTLSLQVAQRGKALFERTSSRYRRARYTERGWILEQLHVVS